jgi:hypothetical protein
MKKVLFCCGVLIVLGGAAALGLSHRAEPAQEKAPAPPSLPAELPRYLEDLKPVPHFDAEVKPAAPTPVPSPGKSTTAKEDLVAELITILNTTESFDTFFVAVNLLEDIGAAAKPAIPTIIRNAERLGAFKNHFLTKGDETDNVEEIYKRLQTIRESKEEGRKEDPPPLPTECVRLDPLLGVTPEPSPPCTLRPKDGQSELLLVVCEVIAKLPKDHDEEMLRVGDLRYRVGRQLLARFADGPVKVKVASARQMEQAAREVKAKQAAAPRELGEKLGADYVLVVTLRSAPLRKTKSGHVTESLILTLSVLDMRTPEDDPVHVEEMIIRDERVEEVDDAQARIAIQEMMLKAAHQIASRFKLAAPPAPTCRPSKELTPSAP